VSKDQRKKVSNTIHRSQWNFEAPDFPLPNGAGIGRLQMLSFPSGVTLFRSELKVEKRCEIDAASDPGELRNLICSQIHLSGKSQLLTPDQHLHSTDPDTGLVFRLSETNTRILLPPKQIIRHIGVSFEIDQLKKRVQNLPEALLHLSRSSPTSAAQVLPVTITPRLRRLCADIFPIAANNESNMLVLEGLSLGIFANIMQNLLPGEKSVFEPTFRESELIDEIARFIIENLSVKLPSDDIANHFSISKNRLNALFRHAHNQNVKEYVRNQRMVSAHQRISETDAPIKAIAAAVGYNHVSNFAIAYRDHFGETPGQTQRRRPA
jgi:AraC-like DNA-binding protein